MIGKVKARGVGDTMLRAGGWSPSVVTSSAFGKVSECIFVVRDWTYFGTGYRECVERA